MMKLAIAVVLASAGCAASTSPYYVRQTYVTPQADFEVRCSYDQYGHPTDACRYVNADTDRDANAIPPDSEDEVTPGALERLKP